MNPLRSLPYRNSNKQKNSQDKEIGGKGVSDEELERSKIELTYNLLKDFL